MEQTINFTCEICKQPGGEDDYAGCCNDGDCRFNYNQLCYGCCEVDEETGVPTCVKCLDEGDDGKCVYCRGKDEGDEGKCVYCGDKDEGEDAKCWWCNARGCDKKNENGVWVHEECE